MRLSLPKRNPRQTSSSPTRPRKPPAAQTHNRQIHLQRTLGNQAAQRLQTKLNVAPPGDRHEQEADRVAAQVMRMPEPKKASPCSCGGECAPCRTKQAGQADLQTQRAETADATQSTVPPIVHEALRAPGHPLDSGTRAFFEPRFGYDLSPVRVHTDRQAVASARAVDALAYTVGRDVVFAEGKYAPHTSQGKKLLAHELTHVVQQGGAAPTLQRQAGGGGAAAPAPRYSVTTSSGCNTGPYNKAIVEAAAQAAFNQVHTSNCVKTKSLKENILDEFNGLTIKCNQGTGNPCGRANRFFSSTVNLYPDAMNAICGPLESTILHEVIHLTEWAPFGHGPLAAGCEKSCFGYGTGDAAKCTYDTGYVPILSASAGKAFPEEGTSTSYARLYLGLEKRGPVLSFVHPSLGIGVGLIGETTGEAGAASAGSTTLVSLLGGLRFDPSKPGGGYLSFFGGPALALGSGKEKIGYEAGAALGYRWRWLDFSVNAGRTYDPTREAGMDRLFTVGATLQIGPSVPR